jgi:hypothetical protein
VLGVAHVLLEAFQRHGQFYHFILISQIKKLRLSTAALAHAITER